MLRIGRVLLLLSVLAAPVVAQGPGSKFGAITGGAVLSDIAGFSLASDDRWGGTAGLMVGVNAGRTAATIEGNWVQKGGGDVRLDYIEFPLTLGAVGVTGGGAYRGRVFSGISFGVKVSCSAPGLACDDAKGTEWGWPFGVQFAKTTESGSFFGFDIRYTIALSDAFEVADSHNRPWQFRLMFGKLLGQS